MIRAAVWRSPAKVNLCLRVVGRRADGYHLLDSIVLPIDLCDRVDVETRDVRPGGAVAVRVSCDHPEVPGGSENLAARAASALLAERGLGGVVTIRLTKRIPPGAGLGGGSGNAATVLLGLNALLDLRVPAARLREIALALGADVPFFLCGLGGRAARVRGIGEEIEPIAGWPGLALVIALPPLAVSTAWAFHRFAERGRPAAGDEPARLAAGAAPAAGLLVNDLEQVVLPAFPAIARLKERLRAAGATAAVMSGSGSAVAAVAPTAAAARAIAGAVGGTGADVRLHVARPFAVDPGGRAA